MKNLRPLELNGIRITDLPAAELRQFMDVLLAKAAKPLHSALLITFNLDFLKISLEKRVFKDVCLNADYVIADGHGITSLLRRFYGKRIDRITGTDIFLTAMTICNEHGLRAALVGSSSEVQKKVVSRINKEYPNCKIVASVSPPYLFEENSEENLQLISALKSSAPDVLFLALGCPRQEIWLYRHKDEIGARINVGIGGVFDFFSGEKKCCPRPLQFIGLEWLWRLLHEPKRLYKRYLINDLPFYLKTFLKKGF